MKNYHMSYSNNKTKTKIRSAFAKNISIDINLTKTQISKVIQSGGYLHYMLGSLDSVGKTLGKR